MGSFEKTEGERDRGGRENPWRASALNAWEKIIGGCVSREETAPEDTRRALYEGLEPGIEDAIRGLGIKANADILHLGGSGTDVKRVTESQSQFAADLVRQVIGVPFDKWSFYPKRISETGLKNCSGGALIIGHLLKQNGLHAYYGNPVNHSVSVLDAADGSLIYMDPIAQSQDLNDLSRNVVALHNPVIEDKNGLKVLKIDQPDIPYKIIPLLSQEDGGAENILENLESLKKSAMTGRDQEASEIYEENKGYFDSAKFYLMNDELYPGLREYYKTDEWQAEEERFGRPSA